MRILLIEDDKIQRENLVKVIEKNYIDLKIYEAGSVMEAELLVESKEIDLFLIDINLPDGSGLDFAKKVRTNPKYKLTGIVFITTQVVQIIDAFKNVHCYDFLIKPYTIDDIRRVIDVFSEEYSSEPIKEGNFFIIPLESGVSVKVYEEDIVFVKYSQRRCNIYTKKSKFQSKALSLSKLIDKCSGDKLIQSHKSYLVNTRYIDKIERVYPKIWNVHFEIINEVAQLSNSYKEEVFRRWQN